MVKLEKVIEALQSICEEDSYVYTCEGIYLNIVNIESEEIQSVDIYDDKIFVNDDRRL